MLNIIKQCERFNPRFIVNDILSLIKNKYDSKVIELFGNRRTGKTIAIFHTIKILLKEVKSDSIAYILCTSRNNVYELNELLHSFDDNIKYVFIDEITLLDNFIEGINLITDTNPSRIMVLTGYASLTFIFSEYIMFIMTIIQDGY